MRIIDAYSISGDFLAGEVETSGSGLMDESEIEQRKQRTIEIVTRMLESLRRQHPGFHAEAGFVHVIPREITEFDIDEKRILYVTGLARFDGPEEAFPGTIHALMSGDELLDVQFRAPGFALG